MSEGFWKRNEKIIMTGLLLVLAPAFAFTTIMTWWLTEGRQQGMTIATMRGEKVSNKDYIVAREELVEILVAQQLRGLGPIGFPPYSRVPGAGEQMVQNYIVGRAEADRMGIEITGAQKQEVLRQAAKEVVTWYRVMRDRNWVNLDTTPGGRQEAYTAWASQVETANINLDEYRDALMSGKFGTKVSVENFEAAVLAGARLQLIPNAVMGLAYASEKEIYDTFNDQNQKRSLEFIQVSSDRFMEDARAAIDQAYLEEVYNANVNLYRKSSAFTIRVAKADRTKFEDPNFEPTLEQVQARYEADKETRYKIFRTPDWVPPEGYNPETDAYRDLIDVFTAVEKSVKDSFAQEEEAKVLNAALAKAKQLDAEGTEFTLEDLFPEQERERIIFDTIDWFTTVDLNGMDQKFRNPAKLRTLFSDPSADRVGEMSTEIIPVSNGDYVYRIAGVEGPRVESLEEAIDKVTRNAERKKAKELTSDFLAEWSTKISSGEESLESFAAAENYTIHASDEPLDRISGFKLKVDDRQVTAGRNVVQALFDETVEIGEVTSPVVYDFDDNVYIARLTEILPADMATWETRRPGIENQVLNNRRTSLSSRYGAARDLDADFRWVERDDDENES